MHAEFLGDKFGLPYTGGIDIERRLLARCSSRSRSLAPFAAPMLTRHVKEWTLRSRPVSAKLALLFVSHLITSSDAAAECAGPHQYFPPVNSSCNTCMIHTSLVVSAPGQCTKHWQYKAPRNASGCCLVSNSSWWLATNCSFSQWAPSKAGFAGGCLSVVSSLAVLISYAAFPSWRQHPADLIWWIALTDLLYGCRFLFNAFSYHDSLRHSAGDCINWCEIFALATQFLFFSSEGWFLTISFDRLLVLRNPFVSLKSMRWRYHAFVWTSSSCLTATLYGSFRLGSGPYNSADNLCWICDAGSYGKGEGKDSWLYSGLSAVKTYALYTPLILGQLIAGGTLFVVWNDLRQTTAISTRRRDAIKNHWKVVIAGHFYWALFLTLKVRKPLSVAGQAVSRVSRVSRVIGPIGPSCALIVHDCTAASGLQHQCSSGYCVVP